MTEIPKQPFFVSPYPDESGGVDFLGIRTVNFALMDELLPSINNVTVAIRPYSLMAWIARAFREVKLADNDDDFSREDFRRFQEKFEVLFGWSHQLRNAGGGLVGNAQVRPEGDGSLPISFEAWRRNVSWLDAVNYGPSLKSENGLGFLLQTSPGIFAVTENGEQLAQALDHSIGQYGDFAALDLQSLETVSPALAEELFDYWSVESPTLEEAQAFRRVLYQPDRIGEDGRVGRRSATLSLILRSLALQNEAFSVDQLRRHMTFFDIEGDGPEDTLAALKKMQSIWRVLQVRQAQRLATEAIFGWIEVRIIDGARNLSSQIADDLIALIENEEGQSAGDSWLQDSLDQLRSEKGTRDSYLAAAQLTESLDFFDQMAAIQEAILEDRDHSVYLSVKLLLLCAELTAEFEEDEISAMYLPQGGAGRLSLSYWKDFVAQNSERPFELFLLDMIENHFLSQHFGIAAARYSEGTQRLRITIEEGGLVSMLNSSSEAWHPTVTRDRLEAALSLLADCRLVNRTTMDDEDYYELAPEAVATLP